MGTVLKFCGQELPFTNTVEAFTAYDNQVICDCNILYGNYDDADKNQSLVIIKQENLPKLKARAIKFLTKVTIDTNGYMHIEFLCVNTGVSKSAVYDAKNIIDYQ